MSNALGAAVFFVVAPVTIAGVIPFVLTQWRLRPTAEHAELLEEIYVGMVRGALQTASTA